MQSNIDMIFQNIWEIFLISMILASIVGGVCALSLRIMRGAGCEFETATSTLMSHWILSLIGTVTFVLMVGNFSKLGVSENFIKASLLLAALHFLANILSYTRLSYRLFRLALA